MKQFRLSRRTMLRGAGGIAIALPWMEVMGTEPAHAQTAATPAKRFMAIYTPGGTVIDKWRPTGLTSETAFTLGAILKPLEALKSKVLLVDGLDMKSAVGEQHQAGIVALLTGTPQNAARSNYASGPSIDQVLATRLSVGKKRHSVQAAVRWATGKSHGLLHPINSMNFSDTGTFAPISPRIDPVQIYADLTTAGAGASTGTPNTDAAARLQRQKSVLDFLNRKYDTLAKRLGAGDRMKLEEHLTRIREIEMSLTAVTNGGAACALPAQVDTSDYNPKPAYADDGSVKDTKTDAAIPKVGKLFMDMLIMYMACDLTAVTSLQWTDTEAKHTFPWLSLTEHHHFYQHDGGFRPVECEKICTWYSQQHAYMLDAMSKIDMGGHSLLDESVVFFGSELSTPNTHGKVDMPLMLAGGGGGLRGGRYLKFNHQSHNDLLVSILNLFGDTRTTFGDAKFCAGPIGKLT